MPATINKSLSAAGTVLISNLNAGPIPDNVAIVEVSGTFSGITATFQGSADGTNFQNLAAVRLDTLAIENTPTVSNNTTRQWKVDVTGMQQFQVNATAVTGTIVTQVNTTYSPYGLQLQLSTAGSLAAGATVITSTSANSLAVGRQGSTNPVLQVDASAATVTTGLLVKGAAAASGLALSVITSGTNENLTLDAAGSGTITLQGTATGNVILGDAINLQFNTTTGTKIGSGTTQKLAFWNATPIVQPANTVDYVTMLTNLGLRATGGTAAATFPGAITCTSILSSGATGGGVGYATGAGGAVSQATDRTTGVTLSKLSGQITTQATSLAAAALVSFTVTNTTVAIGDTILLSIQSGPTTVGTIAYVTTVAAGSFQITLKNLHASTADTGAAILNFVVIKSVAA